MPVALDVAIVATAIGAMPVAAAVFAKLSKTQANPGQSLTFTADDRGGQFTYSDLADASLALYLLEGKRGFDGASGSASYMFGYVTWKDDVGSLIFVTRTFRRVCAPPRPALSEAGAAT